MRTPFYANNWRNSPRYPQTFRSIPVATAQTTPSPSPPLKSRVVSIPVEFIQPENCSKPVRGTKSTSDYAVRIQKIWRGFRVRKNVKKVRDIQRDLDEVERIILDSSTVEAIRKDERERLKVSERLMALLFRLDSISGFDIAVKDLRKTVIRRAILLQEKVDSISVSPVPVDRPMDDYSDAKLCENVEQQNPQDSQFGSLEELHQYQDSDSESCETTPSLIQVSEQNPAEEKGEEELGPVEREVLVVKEEKSNTTLERMVAENNRLMKIMADLYEKSEMQTQILSSLSERVGQLENAFACEKLWRRAKKQKKSRNSNSKSPDIKKGYY